MIENGFTHLDRTEDPKNQRLDDDKRSGAKAKGEVNANVLADVRIAARSAVQLRPLLQPDAAAYTHRRISVPFNNLVSAASF